MFVDLEKADVDEKERIGAGKVRALEEVIPSEKGTPQISFTWPDLESGRVFALEEVLITMGLGGGWLEGRCANKPVCQLSHPRFIMWMRRSGSAPAKSGRWRRSSRAKREHLQYLSPENGHDQIQNRGASALSRRF